MKKKLNDFFKHIDKKRFKFILRLIFLFLIVVLEINIVSIAYSKYESQAVGNIKPDVALFVLDAKTYTGNLSLSGLVPRNDSYTYLIYVTNSDSEDNVSNVNMTYNLTFKTTTNLPLTYDIIDVDTGLSVVSDTTSYTDSNGVYYNVYHDNHTYSFNYGTPEKKYFRVVVNFPNTYSMNPEYQSMIDLFTVEADAKQVV